MPWSNEQDALKQDAKLERADNRVIETAQTGVEYISPQQQGGIYGTVYRQYFSGTSDTLSNATFPSVASSPSTMTLLTVAAATKMVDAEFRVRSGSDVQGAFLFSNVAWVSSPYFTPSGTTLNVAYGSQYDDSPYEGHFDYIK